MEAKFGNFSEMANLLSVKSRVSSDITVLFERFSLGRLLSRMGMRKEQGYSLVQLIMAICMFRVCGKTIHSAYMANFHGLVKTGKNCYYRLLERQSIDWRRLLMTMAVRFYAILRKENIAEAEGPNCLIIDDTTLEKTGIHMEGISRVFDHVKGRCVLGYKLLLCAYCDGKSTLPVDFTVHSEKGRNKTYGLTAKQRKARFQKERQSDSFAATRFSELEDDKISMSIEMVKRATKLGLQTEYVLCDSWFTCEKLLREVRSIDGGKMHFVGLAKFGNTKYKVDGISKNAQELITKYERERTQYCRKYKCAYISLRGYLGEVPVRIFFIHYGHNQKWNVLITTDMSLSFIKAFEIYQMRWSIEVLNKETKQYLGLGAFQGRDFDKLIADCTLCYMTYIVMALDKRINEYETTGKLFAVLKDSLIELTLWKRVLSALERFMGCLCENASIQVDELLESILHNDSISEECLAIAEALRLVQQQDVA